MNASWIIPACVLGIAIWSAAFGWISPRAAILIILAFIAGIWLACYRLRG